ncbi:MAG: Ig-like domain-containing protein [Eubacteriales bacterium]|nr:Ig-like domain-containing protein [Eubacteriales bacterium]
MCKKMNLKRLSAMVLTLTMLISVFGFGQMTAVNANGGGISIFSANFDQEPYPEFVQLSNGGKPQFSVENGLAYINDDPGWSYGGFVFDDAISTSEYEIEFDFKILNYYNNYGVVYLTDEEHGGSSQPGEFRLINLNNGAMSVGGTSVNVAYENDKWFSYKMTANSADGTYSVTVTEKDNATNTATANGSDFPTKALDRMMFGTACKIHIDNINVKKLVDAPKVLSVKYFGQDGKKQTLPGVTTTCIAVSFSDKMDLASLKSAVSYKGSDGVNIANEGTLSEDQMTYTFNLSKKLNGGADYTLGISTAAKSIYDAAIASAYTLIETASDGAVIFDADFEKRIPEFVQLSNNGKPDFSVENGVAYINDDPGWTYGGFVFDDAISSGEYEIEFDFNISNYYNNYGVVYLTDEAHGGSSQPGEFRLINLNEGAMSVGSKAVNTAVNIAYANEKWFHYSMQIDKDEKTYTVTVTEKDNPTNTATANGSDFPTKALDRMMFGTACKIHIDNINVKKVIKSAKVSRVEYLDIDGNVMPSLNASVAAIKIFFSDKMAYRTLDGAVTLKGSDNENVNYTGAAADDNTAYVLNLNDILFSGDSYTLSVTANALSQLGLSAEPYSKTLTVSDGKTMLDIDYDSETRALETWSGSPVVEYPEENGNKYMTINAKWTNSGYSLDRTIPKDGGDYNVKFDFKNASVNSGGDGGIQYYVALTQKDCLAQEGEKSTYDTFGLLAISGEKVKVAGVEYDDLTYKDNTWYSYDLTFNRSTGDYTLIIFEKDNAESRMHESGTFSKSGNGGNGLWDNRLYDAIKFYGNHTISVDNILIRQADNTSPELGDNSLTYITNGGEVSGDLNNISLNTAKIAIDFKDIINIRTAQGKISLKASDNTEVGYTLSQDGTKLILNLNEGLKAETEYKLTISNGIKSLSDSVVTGVKEFTLKTGKKEFSAKLSALKIGETEVLNYSQWKAAEATVKLNVTNTMGEDVTVPLVIAYFAQSGELLDIQSIDVTIADKSEGEQTKATTLKKPENAVRAKVMCWKSLDSAKPLSKMLDIR